MNMNGRAFITLAHTTGACLTSQAPYKKDDIVAIELVLVSPVADICLCKRCRSFTNDPVCAKSISAEERESMCEGVSII